MSGAAGAGRSGPAAPRGAAAGELVGTGGAVRLILRRDRLVVPLWVLLAVLVPYGVSSGAAGLYGTAAALRRYTAEALANPAEVAMRGLIYAPTLGGVTAWGAGMAGALIAGVASLLIVIRHTRAEEETGRRELLGSTVFGRHAGLTAVLAVVTGVNLLAGVLEAAALTGLGLPFPGALVLGLSTAGVGVTMAATAAVAAQLTAGSGGACGIAFAALAAFFLLRAVGDSRGSAVSWLSPFGWARLSRAFTGDRWWVLALFAAFTLVAAAIAYTLAARRDVAAGLLPPRAGPPYGAPSLRSPVALAWRTHRGTLLAWTVACAAVGALLGAAAPGAEGQLTGIFSGASALFTFALLVLSQAVAGYTILTLLRPRTEEGNGLAELLLGTAPARLRWAGAHALVAYAGSLVLLAAAGLGAGMTYGLATGGALLDLLGGALVWLPAVWVVAGIAFALLGLAPRAAVAVSWLALVAFLLVELAYEFGRVNRTVLDLSPFSHVPRIMLGQPVSAGALAGLLGAAALLAVAGALGLRRRDIG